MARGYDDRVSINASSQTLCRPPVDTGSLMDAQTVKTHMNQTHIHRAFIRSFTVSQHIILKRQTLSICTLFLIVYN